MMTRRTAVLVAAASAVSPCSRPTLDVRMTGGADGAWISLVNADGLFGLFADSIAGVTVQATDNTPARQPRETAWAIHGPRVREETLRRIRYGVLPSSFTQDTAPRALSDGYYVLTAWSYDYLQGEFHFAIVNGGVAPDPA